MVSEYRRYRWRAPLALSRLSRLEAKQDTRDRLLDAARRVFLREGFHAATVDMVAAEAGFTKGAVYSAFASKAEFFLALYESRTEQRIAAMEKRLAALAGPLVPGEVSRVWSETLRRDRAWHLVLIEFWVFAARDPSLRSRFAQLHGKIARIARALRSRTRRRARVAVARIDPASRRARAHGARQRLRPRGLPRARRGRRVGLRGGGGGARSSMDHRERRNRATRSPPRGGRHR
jgi:AcrR family transcriptional regulator